MTGMGYHFVGVSFHAVASLSEHTREQRRETEKRHGILYTTRSKPNQGRMYCTNKVGGEKSPGPSSSSQANATARSYMNAGVCMYTVAFYESRLQT